MKKYIFSNPQFYLVIFSLSFCFFLLGLDAINPLNQNWLLNGDLTQYQLGWKFFRNDIWRFPIGLNPNFGISDGSSIIYSDSIPFFAIIFKILRNFLPENFQYFSIWIFLSLYLQGYFSYRILNYYTNNKLFSIIASLFFIFSTILIYRSGIHLSLTAHWLILAYYYIQTSSSHKNKNLKKHLLIHFSALVHFYFTITLIIIFFLEKIINFKKNIVVKELLDFSFLLIMLFFLMYIIGYFTIDLDDGLGYGYGIYNFNLNSFFNPSGANYINEFSWSNFIPQLELQNSEMEGFAYLGLSGIIFFILYLINLYKGKFKIVFLRKESFLIFFILLIIATSNNINFGGYNLFDLQLNKYIYAFFSSVRASGRLIWPIYYLIFITGIIFTFHLFKNNRPEIIISILLLFQLIDIYPGIKNYSLGSQYQNKNEFSSKLNSKLEGLSNQFLELRLLEPKNNSDIYYMLNEHILNESYERTDVSYLARVNREEIEQKKYQIISELNKKSMKIFKKKLFVSDNINYIKNIYYLFKNNLHYYKLDRVWLVSDEEIENLQNVENRNLINFYSISDLKKKINFKINSPYGLGWEINDNNEAIMNGHNSSMIFELQKELCNNNLEILFDFRKYFEELDDSIILDIKLNDIYYDKLEIVNNFKYSINISKECKQSPYLKIDFFVHNPSSLYDLKKGLNRKKRSFIINKIVLLNK